MAQARSEAAGSEDGSESSKSEQEFKQKVGFTVGYQLANIARQKIAQDWPSTSDASWKEAKDWFPNLHKYLTQRMTNLGDYCVICDDLQPISGQLV